MGAETEIAWTDATFNPWHGCVRVSPGCQKCYAEAFSKRTGHNVWGVTAPRRFFGDKHWNEPRKWNADAEKAGVRKRVFCASMADVFEDRDDLRAPRLRLWDLIGVTPWLDWQLLTKRPENIVRFWRWDRIAPPKNVWLGTTTEDQEWYRIRWPALASAASSLGIRTTFVSYEPALGPLEIECSNCGHDVVWHVANPDGCSGIEPGSGWFPSQVIIGGESGGGARPFDVAWARSVIAQCRYAGIAPFFKQAGAHAIDGHVRLKLAHVKGGDLGELPQALSVREFPESRGPR